MKTQYRPPAPRKTNRLDQAHRLFKYMTKGEQYEYRQVMKAIAADPLLKL